MTTPVRRAGLLVLLVTSCSSPVPPPPAPPPPPRQVPLDAGAAARIIGQVLDQAFLGVPPVEATSGVEPRDPFSWSCLEAAVPILAGGFDRGLDPAAAGLAEVEAAVGVCRAARALWEARAGALVTFPPGCLGPGALEDLVACTDAAGTGHGDALRGLASAAGGWREAAAAARAAVLGCGGALADQLLGGASHSLPPVPDALRTLLGDPAGFWPPLEAGLASLQGLRLAHARYLELVRAGGWMPLPPEAAGLRRGRRSPAVPALRARLAAEGYLAAPVPAAGEEDLVDGALAAALGRFQVDHGLDERRRMDRETLAALDEPALRKLARVRLALRALSRAAGPAPEDLILVHAPAAVAEVVFGGRPWRTLRVVLGSPRREWVPEKRRRDFIHRTPEVASAIERVVLSPEWLVPDTIKERELDPKLEEEPDWYAKNGYRLRQFPDGRELAIQEPGSGNALGRVKFLFPNDYGVYLHDTPSKRLFRRPRRLFSHGCVRVENALELAAEILGRDQGWDWERVRRAAHRDRPVEVKLLRPVPVRVVYLTVDAHPARAPRWIADAYRQEDSRVTEEVRRLEVLLGEAVP
ncbi:MAG: L,D-transpeptidase family protein [Deltaproteobacteria bacterium]|nr:L,D-transpeptidase family protein [Deltaproteobacteria bacterium]